MVIPAGRGFKSPSATLAYCTSKNRFVVVIYRLAMNLVEQLIDQLGVSRQQAEGGAGLLLRHAQLQLSTTDFLSIADAIPAISDLIGKAPRQAEPTPGAWSAWWQRLRAFWQRWFSGWGTLAPLRETCERLELDRATINNFIAVTGGYFREQAGTQAESLLLGVWR